MFWHSLHLAGRNWRSYAFLSVTIFLSFTLLLGLFLFSDAKIYNRYKKLFSVSEKLTKLGVAYDGLDDAALPASVTAQRFTRLEEQFERISGTTSFRYYPVSVQFPQYDNAQATVYFVPSYLPFFYAFDFVRSENVPVTFSEAFGGVLGDHEIVIDERFYEYLMQSETFRETKQIGIPVRLENGQKEMQKFTVIATFSHVPGSVDDVFPLGSLLIFAPASSNCPNEQDLANWSMQVMSDLPLIVKQMATGAQKVTCHSYADDQQKARQEMLNAAKTKETTILALYILLGVNLYSSFRNALSRREFEIGVKRAIGARKIDIVRQFFDEGLVVMGINLAATIWTVMTAALVYKLIQRVVFDTQWTIYLSPHSIVMFSICAVSMSLFYSLIFAVQSAHVDLIAYLNHE